MTTTETQATSNLRHNQRQMNVAVRDQRRRPGVVKIRIDTTGIPRVPAAELARS